MATPLDYVANSCMPLTRYNYVQLLRKIMHTNYAIIFTQLLKYHKIEFSYNSKQNGTQKILKVWFSIM